MLTKENFLPLNISISKDKQVYSIEKDLQVQVQIRHPIQARFKLPIPNPPDMLDDQLTMGWWKGEEGGGGRGGDGIWVFEVISAWVDNVHQPKVSTRLVP